MIFPHPKDHRFQLEINGQVGIRALVGYLKMMPGLCRQMDELQKVTDLLKATYPSLRIYYKTVEPGCEVYLKNDAEGKYFPEAEEDGCPFQMMTEEQEQLQTRIIRGILNGGIEVKVGKE